MVSRHSAFYSPLIAAIAAGFLEQEGLSGSYRILRKGENGRDLIRRGEIDVMQAAVSSNWGPMEAGESDLPVHFAQINQRDGFFLVGRIPDPAFEWRRLEGASLLADHGGQPLVMLRYAAHRMGADWNRIRLIDAGAPQEMEGAFRSGRGDYVHLQGPASQRLVRERIGSIVARVGDAIPPVAFSSLMASRAFLLSPSAGAFMRAFRKSKEWVQQARPKEIAAKESPFFPSTDLGALEDTIAEYQKLGCWEGSVSIPLRLYEQALEVFLFGEAIRRRHRYEEVVVAAPE
jgi:NitT/TauT family transport system substrate-binding protein